MMTKTSIFSRGPALPILRAGCVLLAVAAGLLLGGEDASAKDIYIRAGDPEGGDGSEKSPFTTLSAAEAASEPWDSILIIPGDSTTALDGGIALKPGQKLIGLAPDGNLGGPDMDGVRMINTTDRFDGVIVKLSERNEVAGIHHGWVTLRL